MKRGYSECSGDAQAMASAEPNKIIRCTYKDKLVQEDWRRQEDAMGLESSAKYLYISSDCELALVRCGNAITSVLIGDDAGGRWSIGVAYGLVTGCYEDGEDDSDETFDFPVNFHSGPWDYRCKFSHPRYFMISTILKHIHEAIRVSTKAMAHRRTGNLMTAIEREHAKYVKGRSPTLKVASTFVPGLMIESRV